MSDNNTQAAIDAGMANAVPHEIDPAHPVYGVVVPNGGNHVLIDTSKWAPVPRRATGTYRPATVAAFSEVVERHLDPAQTTIWVHPSSGRIVAIFNDNPAGGAQWRDHRAELQLTPTREWMHWLSRDGSLLSQREFAEHIEDGLSELSDPPAADMLELAQTFQAKQDVNFRSATRLQDGTVQAQYDEKIDAQAGTSGQLSIPTQFTLAIAPFLGEDPYKVTARLRYRLNSGKLSIGYKLDRPHDVVRDTLDKIAETLTSTHNAPVVIGDAG